MGHEDRVFAPRPIAPATDAGGAPTASQKMSWPQGDWSSRERFLNLGRRFLRHGRALKQGQADFAGEVFDLPGVG